MRAWSTIAAVKSFAGSNSDNVNPSSHDDCPQVMQCSCTRFTFHCPMWTRSDPHWQKTSEGTPESRSLGEEKANHALWPRII